MERVVVRSTSGDLVAHGSLVVDCAAIIGIFGSVVVGGDRRCVIGSVISAVSGSCRFGKFLVGFRTVRNNTVARPLFIVSRCSGCAFRVCCGGLADLVSSTGGTDDSRHKDG